MSIFNNYDIETELEDKRSNTNRNRRRTDPWWLYTIIRLGVPAAIAIYLTYFLVSTVNNNLAQAKELIVSHVGDTLQQKEREEKMLYTLQRICANLASTNQERNECFR